MDDCGTFTKLYCTIFKKLFMSDAFQENKYLLYYAGAERFIKHCFLERKNLVFLFKIKDP